MLSLRFVQRDSVADLAPSLAATEPLDGASLGHVLIRLARQGVSGEVSVKRDDGFEASLAILDGAAQRMKASGFSDDGALVEHLRAGGKVDATALDAILRTAKAEKKPLPIAVFRAGLATVQDIAHALRLGRVALLARCLAPGEGLVAFTPRADVPKDPIAVPLAQALFAHYRERLEPSSIRDVEPRLGDLLYRFPLATFETTLFTNGAESALIDQYCTGNLSSRTVIDRGSLGPVRGSRLLLMLFAFDALDARNEPLRITQNLDVTEAVEARLPAVDAGSHFEVLDVHWTAHPREIEAKYREEARRFDAFLAREGLSEELAGDVRLVRLALDGAWRVLSDPAKRHQFRARTYTPQQIDFAASFLHQQAELAVFRRDERTARGQLEAAIDLSGDKRFADALATLWQRIHKEGEEPEVKRPVH